MMVEEEPTRGSVVMVYGPSGTAFQRFFSDGQWHGTNGEVCSWGGSCRSRRPVTAPARCSSWR
jgi:hypothetical protein